MFHTAGVCVSTQAVCTRCPLVCTQPIHPCIHYGLKLQTQGWAEPDKADTYGAQGRTARSGHHNYLGTVGPVDRW